eukprot:1577250-Rhodomonas_salina.4
MISGILLSWTWSVSSRSVSCALSGPDIASGAWSAALQSVRCAKSGPDTPSGAARLRVILDQRVACPLSSQVLQSVCPG